MRSPNELTSVSAIFRRNSKSFQEGRRVDREEVDVPESWRGMKKGDANLIFAQGPFTDVDDAAFLFFGATPQFLKTSF